LYKFEQVVILVIRSGEGGSCLSARAIKDDFNFGIITRRKNNECRFRHKIPSIAMFLLFRPVDMTYLMSENPNDRDIPETLVRNMAQKLVLSFP